MTDPRAYLADVLAKAEAATPGPWAVKVEQNDDGDWDASEITHTYMLSNGTQWPNQILGYFDLNEPDGTFITSARTTSPAMARALIAVLENLDGLERLAELNRIEAERRDEAGEDSGRAWSAYHTTTRIVAHMHELITTELAKEIEHG